MKLPHLLIFIFLPQLLFAQTRAADSTWVLQNYTKTETYIPMRDGIKLYTAIYQPKDSKEKHPILINRTPFSCTPYGADFQPMWSNYWINYLNENYIIVVQDVRGRYMSEGEFVNVRPYIEHKKGKKDIDESTDAYDTIDWLIKHTENNNGKVGVFGISYRGFYATMAALSGHPALKAVSPQAPVTDWYAGDDFHHNGALMLMDVFGFCSGFAKPRSGLTTQSPKAFDFKSDDAYNTYLNINTIDSLSKLLGDSIQFWKDICAHPDYDIFWQARNVCNYVQHIPDGCATLVVGGLYDAEDCYGAWALYKAIEQKAHNDNRLVMGPWAHGQWAKDSGYNLGNIWMGGPTSIFYQQDIELLFFQAHLKGYNVLYKLNECTILSSGSNTGYQFSKWDDTLLSASLPKATIIINNNLYLQAQGKLSSRQPQGFGSFDYYLSDPSKPVPYTEKVGFNRTKEYMTDDQRFAARRPDVLVYQTDTLTADLQLAGPVIADLFTSISTTDADFIVKIIDVFPDNFNYNDDFTYVDYYKSRQQKPTYPMGGYQMLVRAEVMRGRYRNSLEKPEPFVPEEVTEVKYALPDVSHVFKKGHRLMVQIQSSWFPLVDRNPQKFVNIYTAQPEDFVRSTITIHHDREHPSHITLPIVKEVN